MADSQDNANGGGADFGSADGNSFGGDISATGGPGGFGGIGGGNGIGGGGLSNGGGDLGSAGSFGGPGGAVVDLSGSTQGVDAASAAVSLENTIAALGFLAMGNPIAAVQTLVNSAGMSYSQAVNATREAISFAYSSNPPAVADTMMNAFTQ